MRDGWCGASATRAPGNRQACLALRRIAQRTGELPAGAADLLSVRQAHHHAQTTIGEALGDTATGLLDHLNAWLAAPKLKNEQIAAEDKLAYNEPSDMIFATRHMLGAELLAAGQPATAEAVYREDLKQHPNNGWAYLGLSQALAAQKRDADAAAAKKQFEQAWRSADVPLTASAF